MTRAKQTLIGFLYGLIFSIFLFYLSLFFSPWPHLEINDVKALQEFAVSKYLTESPPETLYVGGEWGSELIELLKKKYPNTEFKRFLERPKENCDFAPCGEANVFNVNITFPLWRLAKVQVGSFNSATEVTLIKIGSSWYPIYLTGFII